MFRDAEGETQAELRHAAPPDQMQAEQHDCCSGSSISHWRLQRISRLVHKAGVIDTSHNELYCRQLSQARA